MPLLLCYRATKGVVRSFLSKHRWLQIMRKERHKTTCKPTCELSRFALRICDRQTELNECTRWLVCQTTHYGCRKKGTEQMRWVANVPNCPLWSQTNRTERNVLRGQCVKQPICNAFLSYFIMPFTFTYVLRTITGYIMLKYCLHLRKPLNSLIYNKNIYSHLALLSLFFFSYAFNSLLRLHISTPNVYKKTPNTLLHPLMNTFLPLCYNQFWTLQPNTFQYFFGQLRNMMLYTRLSARK